MLRCTGSRKLNSPGPGPGARPLLARCGCGGPDQPGDVVRAARAAGRGTGRRPCGQLGPADPARKRAPQAAGPRRRKGRTGGGGGGELGLGPAGALDAREGLPLNRARAAPPPGRTSSQRRPSPWLAGAAQGGGPTRRGARPPRRSRLPAAPRRVMRRAAVYFKAPRRVNPSRFESASADQGAAREVSEGIGAAWRLARPP
jgi:hypothetical protein